MPNRPDFNYGLALTLLFQNKYNESFNLFEKIFDICGIKKMMQISLLDEIIKISDDTNLSEEKICGNFKGKYFGLGPKEINLRFFLIK